MYTQTMTEPPSGFNTAAYCCISLLSFLLCVDIATVHPLNQEAVYAWMIQKWVKNQPMSKWRKKGHWKTTEELLLKTFLKNITSQSAPWKENRRNKETEEIKMGDSNGKWPVFI